MIPRLALLLALVPCVAWAQPQGQNKTAWRFGPPNDNGSRRVAAIVEATGRYDGNRPLLDVRCWNGETQAFVYWPQYLGTGPTIAMKWRTNDSTVKTEDWTLSSATGRVSHPTPIAFLRGLFGKTELIVSVTPHSGAEVSAIFPIAGVEDAVKPIIDSCKPDPTPEARPTWGLGHTDRGGSRERIATLSPTGVRYSRNYHPGLTVRCMRGNQTGVFIDWSRLLGTGATIAVKWRTNDSAEQTESWTLHGREVSHPTPIPFLKSLFGKTELTVSVMTQYGTEPSLTFAIAGIEDAMKWISDACKWEAAPKPQPKAGAPK